VSVGGGDKMAGGAAGEAGIQTHDESLLRKCRASDDIATEAGGGVRVRATSDEVALHC